MANYEFPTTPEIDRAYRSASAALAALLPQHTTANDQPEDVVELLSRWPRLVSEAELFVTAQLGPTVSWTGPPWECYWDLIAAGVDLDDNGHDFGEIELGEDAFEGANGRWSGSAFDQAALVYKRACGWDFAPDEAGVWLVMLAPTGAIGGEDGPWSFSGRLTGFVIVYDRDQDGAYEAVGHIWTAAAWRRRGIAQRLVHEARSRFPIAIVEPPYTSDGAAFLEAGSQT